MLITKTVPVRWNSRNKKRLESLGYTYTGMGDIVNIDVNDMSKGSNEEVTVKCDYCGRTKQIKWYTYLKTKGTICKKDACQECLQIKARESVEEKYGTFSGMYEASNEKRQNTIVEKYGVCNVFASDDVKKKIAETNINKYGYKCSLKNKYVKEKSERSCLDRYGVKNYVELFKGKFIKENSPVWKGGVSYSRVERATHEYIKWRNSVYSRDEYRCQCCGERNGSGHAVTLCAHHIKNWKDNPDDRYDVSNGITLCEKCHNKFHSVYGKRNNTHTQLNEFLKIYLDKKIC